MKKKLATILITTIENKIYLIRGVKVMLDKDLAYLYEIKPIALRQQIKRNKERFPKNFMFQLNKEYYTPEQSVSTQGVRFAHSLTPQASSWVFFVFCTPLKNEPRRSQATGFILFATFENKKEAETLLSQNVIASKKSFGGSLPYVFTEHGVTMLSSVLKSKKAVQVNIAIVRAFIKLRELLATHKNLILEIDKIKREQKNQNQKINSVINIINQMLNPKVNEKEPIGFREKNKK